MRFQEPLHWAEGQFLQPHHFQEQDRILFLQRAAERSFYLYYREGLIDFAVDTDALSAGRVSILKLSALLSDGLAVSMPGNIEIKPLTLQFDAKLSQEPLTVYLSVPFYSMQDPNLCEDLSGSRRYMLHETSRVDANSADNETVLIKHRYCARLITDLKQGSGCAVLPLMKLTWSAAGAGSPLLTLAEDYIPPYVVLPSGSALFNLTGELIYELKASRDKLISDLESSGFDPEMPSGRDLLRLARLTLINTAVQELSSLLVPGSVTPFTLYLSLSRLLAGLLAQAPERDQNSIVPYDHYNLSAVFQSLALNIRAFLTARGKASCLEVPFVPAGEHTLKAELNEEHFIKGKEYYLCLDAGSELPNLVELVEQGDNLRLIDLKSVKSRVRGIKLNHLRFPPRYLPDQGGQAKWFRLNREESARMWRYIVEDKAMVIDYAAEIFPALKAKLFAAVLEE